MILCMIVTLSFSACNSVPDSVTELIKNTDKTEDEISFTEVVAVDNDECMIKITEIDPDHMWGYALKAQLENKSTEKTYMFTVEAAAINGLQCDASFAQTVAAGEKADGLITFDNDQLKEFGVGVCTDIELTFFVYDSSKTYDVVAKETIHIYPYGEDKAVKFIREAQASDNVIIDNDYVTVIVTGYEYDDYDNCITNLFLINKTDKPVGFFVGPSSVNGFMIPEDFIIGSDSDIHGSSSIWTCGDVTPENCAFGYITLFDDDLEENGITEIEEIEFLFRAYAIDDRATYLVDEVITLNP